MTAAYVFKILSIIKVRVSDRSLILSVAGEDLDLNEASVREEIEGKTFLSPLMKSIIILVETCCTLKLMIFEIEEKNGFSGAVFPNPAQNSSPSVRSTLGCRMTFFRAVGYLCMIVNTSRVGIICVTQTRPQLVPHKQMQNSFANFSWNLPKYKAKSLTIVICFSVIILHEVFY